MRPHNLTYQDILTYTPFDNKFNKGNAVSKDDFYKFFFVAISEFEIEFKNLQLRITPAENQFKPLYVLTGYSGNGKTTFVNWFKEIITLSKAEFQKLKKSFEENKEYLDLLERIENIRNFNFSYKFEVLNLVQQASGFKHTKELISETLYNDLQSCFSNQIFFEKITKCQETRNLFLKLLNRNGKYDKANLWNRFNMLQINYDEETRYLVNDTFIKILPFKIQMIFYVFGKLVLEKNLEKIESYTFCFDNLDELSIEYLTNQIWKDFLDIRDTLINIFQQSSYNIPFESKVVFLLVFREANLAVSNAQSFDRLEHSIFQNRFILSRSGRNILGKRLEIAENSKFEINSRVHDLNKVLIEDSYTDKVFLPLFNFDYRKMLNAVLELTSKDYKESERNLIFNLDYKIYKSIKEISVHGARGILVNSFIRYLIYHDFLSEFASHSSIKDHDNDEALCRSSRMILTAICSLSYPNGFPSDRDSLKELMPKQFTLLDLFGELTKLDKISKSKSVISLDDLFKWLNEFFLVDRSSWAHLISIYNKNVVEINSDNVLDFTEEKLKIDLYSVEGKEFFLKPLDLIKIQLNASGYIYLRYLIIHFEYFSSLDFHNKPRKDCVPLFLATGLINNNRSYLFEKTISLVINRIKNYLRSMTSFAVLHQIDLEAYSRSNFSFQPSQSHLRQLYSSRIITANVRYIDEFRKFIMTSEDFAKKNEQHRLRHKTIKSIGDINHFLLDGLEELVLLLQNDKHNSAINKSYELFKKNLNINRRDDSNYLSIPFG